MILEAALALAARGWPVFPVRGKEPLPGSHGFKDASNAPGVVRSMFKAEGLGIGVATGEQAGVWVLDVDPGNGGHVSYESLEFEHGPLETLTCLTGGGGRHLYFKWPAGGSIRNRTGVLAGLDVRGEGGYVVAPPSPHPSGKHYAWADDEAEITVAPDWLIDLVTRKAEPKQPSLTPTEVRNPAAYGRAALERACSEIANCKQGGRNDTLNKAAFTLRDLLIKGWLPARAEVERRLLLAAEECGLSTQEARKSIASALGNAQAPEAPAPAESDKLIIPDASPLRLAENFLDTQRDPKGRLTLRRWCGQWWRYNLGAYSTVDQEMIESELWKHLDKIYVTGDEGPKRLNPKLATISNVRAALTGSNTMIDSTVEPPCWVGGHESNRPDPRNMVAVRNGLLNLTTGELMAATPDLFSTASLPVAWDPEARTPSLWCDFLQSLWPEDQDAINTLQEWFGYCLTPDTSQQKLLLVLGPKRSGKGTIVRLLTGMLGQQNVASPTLTSLASPFGIQPLIGKLLATIADARMSGRTDQAVIIERLLSISGEDALSVERKFLEAMTVKLGARIMIVSNELPRFTDSSGALASRCLVLQLKRSFYGAEDLELWDKLKLELPSILKWSVEGWRKLHADRFFRQPKSGIAPIDELNDLSSPVAAFVEDECSLESDDWIECQTLYDRWVEWCKQKGFMPGSIQILSRDLRAAFPGIGVERPRTALNRSRRYTGIKTKGL